VAKSSVVVNEGSIATNRGTIRDLDSQSVIVSASLGTITQQNGRWTWSYAATDDLTTTVVITATDNEHAVNVASFRLKVKNVAPTAIDARFQLPENSPRGTSVGFVVATDSGSDTLRYSIVGGSGATAFAINSTTGEITVADASQLDFETTRTLKLKVRVADGDGGSDTADVTFDLLNNPSIDGAVFIGGNQIGQIIANETGIDGVILELLNEHGTPIVNASGAPLTATTAHGGLYRFEDLVPGTYRVHERQPGGVTDGPDFLGSLGGTIAASDTLQLTLQRTDAHDYIFAEIAAQQLVRGDTAQIGFWQNKNGQDLIKLGGSALANWLTTNFANVFGNSLAGASGADVATFYKDQLFKQPSKQSAEPAKVDAQFMAVALAVYFTNRSLAGNVAATFGFNVTDSGIGAKIVNVGASGVAFSVANNSGLTVMQLLQATNRMTDTSNRRGGFTSIYDGNSDGVLDATEAELRSQAAKLYTSINETGGI
jgi:hypothetical protein